jgi:hypothetical protein
MPMFPACAVHGTCTAAPAELGTADKSSDRHADQERKRARARFEPLRKRPEEIVDRHLVPLEG